MNFLNSPIVNQNGFVGISQDYHFEYDGERIRFFGASLSYDANFPDNEDAKPIAKRLAKLGVNLVRLHHMDHAYAPQGIWHYDEEEPSKTVLDTDQMAKLDYFINQLKINGIFINLNLHVSRELSTDEGIVDDEFMPTFNKGVDLFDDRMRVLHKQYATDLLTHVS